jgi:UDP-sulfoquinovose synthase
VFNQFVETFTVMELAQRVQSAGSATGIDVQIKQLANPRKELESHYYNPAHTGLLELGLQPHLLTQGVIGNMMELVSRYRNRISTERIFRGVKWKN